MYYAKIKDNIAISLGMTKPELSFDCDRIEEIEDDLAYRIKLPAKFVDGKWVHTDEFPVVEYPVSEPVEELEPEPTIEEQITDIQELVVQQQYELELLKLGIEV